MNSEHIEAIAPFWIVANDRGPRGVIAASPPPALLVTVLSRVQKEETDRPFPPELGQSSGRQFG